MLNLISHSRKSLDLNKNQATIYIITIFLISRDLYYDNHQS